LSGRSKKNELRRASFAGLNGGGFQSEGAAEGGGCGGNSAAPAFRRSEAEAFSQGSAQNRFGLFSNKHTKIHGAS
jgi:hypothetical protein